MLPLSKNVALNSEIKSNEGRCEGWSGKGGERGVALVRAVGYAFRADCQGFGDGLRKGRHLSNYLYNIAFYITGMLKCCHFCNFQSKHNFF